MHLDLPADPIPDLPPDIKQPQDDAIDLDKTGDELQGNILYAFPAGKTAPIKFRRGPVVCP
jgi:hypothetical protein